MESITIDGNNILEVYDTIKGVREYCIKNQKPFLVECMTFRMRGHEEASGTKYYPEGLQDEWSKQDPVSNYELFLKESNILTDELAEQIKNEIKEEILKSENKMVKKIRVIDELDEAPDVQQTLFEIAKSIDWKLWELLQTMQRLEKKLSVINEPDDDE